VRRHPLARRLRLVGGILVATFLAASVGACLPGASTAFGVTIATAPGETQAFVPAELTVQAPGRIAITFRNGSSLAHNLVFAGGLTGASRTIVEPGTTDEILLEPAAPGTYPFACTIHDGMAGALIVIK
jgi:plastocyanin